MSDTDFKLPLIRRPRRSRISAPVRDLFQENRLHPSQLIQPVFVKAEGLPEPLPSMPGIQRIPQSELVDHCKELRDLGICAVALFPCIDKSLKDDCGSYGTNPDNFLYRSLHQLKIAVSDLMVITDVALDPYTHHGHDGLLNPATNDVDNDRTVHELCRMAVVQANSGVDWVAPSDMMDGRVGQIRAALDEAGHTHVGILAYSAKFASSYYGPFREAVGSASAAGHRFLDKRTYQLNPANFREAILEALLDEEEGADALMVKPAGPYLDVLYALRQKTLLPIAAYQVSGEYAQIHAAARMGWLDLKAARNESLIAIRRAGADVILTYFAAEFARDL